MITTSDKELLQAKLHKTPLSVFVSVGSAAALASLVIVRILWTYQQAGKPIGRALMYAGLIALFIFSNALSLLTKSKTGYGSGNGGCACACIGIAGSLAALL